ncbi:hypothetical protein [Streptomyces anulatus]
MPDLTPATPALTELDMSRAVIEHALTVYGYSTDTARFLIDRLITEARAE